MTKEKILPSGLSCNFRMVPVGDTHWAIVDRENYDAVSKFAWRPVRAHFGTYAKTTIYKDGKRITISMHRFIAGTPRGLVCHHVNGKTMDNRKCNLNNMDKKSHRFLHLNNSIMIKSTPCPPGH